MQLGDRKERNSGIESSFAMSRALFKRMASFASWAERCLDSNFLIAATSLICVNACLCWVVIQKVPYTEIDWVAYMEEVSGVLNEHQYDYKELRGGTGPLVYPAGFVYIYSFLYYLTDRGRDILTAQWIFAVLHCVNLGFVLFIYRKCYADRANPQRFPLWIVGFLLLSRRVMSLFVLRLFNDGIQMLLIYVAISCFVSNKWSAGCFVYSLSVSVKMNALLFAPGIAVLLCQARGMGGAFRRILGICLTTQLVLGAPFLAHAPKSYLSHAFEVTREFLYKWSVNGAFLQESIFLDKKLALLLLMLHLATLVLFGHMRWTAKTSGGLMGLFHSPNGSVKGWLDQLLNQREARDLNASHIAGVLFSSNFIGIAFARTMHYQFYVWYAHSLPFLVCRGSLNWIRKLAVLLTVEAVFNVYPPGAVAAMSLLVAHLNLLLSLWMEKQATDASIFKEVDSSKTDKSS